MTYHYGVYCSSRWQRASLCGLSWRAYGPQGQTQRTTVDESRVTCRQCLARLARKKARSNPGEGAL